MPSAISCPDPYRGYGPHLRPPRVTPVEGRRVGNVFWLVSEFGEKSRQHSGTAHLLPDDDPVARLRSLPRGNSAGVRALGTSLLTVRVDLGD